MIDLTPTWRSLVPVMAAAIQDGTDLGRRLAIEELYRMADFCDARPVDPVRDAAPDMLAALKHICESIERAEAVIGKASGIDMRGGLIEIANLAIAKAESRA